MKPIYDFDNDRVIMRWSFAGYLAWRLTEAIFSVSVGVACLYILKGVATDYLPYLVVGAKWFSYASIVLGILKILLTPLIYIGYALGWDKE